MAYLNPEAGEFRESGLTGWETDEDGNLVMTGDGSIKGSAAHGLIMRGGFLDGGPTTQEEGYVLRVYDDNFDYGSEPSEHLGFFIDGFNASAELNGYVFRVRTSGGSGVIYVQSTDAIGGIIQGGEASGDGTISILAQTALGGQTGMFFNSNTNVGQFAGNILNMPTTIEMANPPLVPDAPAAGKARIYVRDSGGKVQLVAVFPSGAVQQIAIEP